MMSTKNVDERDESPKSKGFHYLAKIHKKKKLLLVGAVAFVVLVLIITLLSGGENSTRTESYKDVSGAAGLQATITYDGKPVSNSNVYIFKEDGQQIAVVRPDKDGNVNLALAEDNYIMLIGKRFGKDKVFPEEPLALKNGKMLELKLHYE